MSKIKRRVVWGGLGVVAIIAYALCLPAKLFNDSYSTVLEDYQGELLTATISKDGQWRFPEVDTIPEKFKEAIVAFEDKRFWNHPGVDPFSLTRAIKQNFQTGKIVSGGSTLTMQVIRLSRKGQGRTIWEKFIEVILATRLELKYSKEEILKLYASHAPFGGNVVGLEAACWRYFGRDPQSLSWAEAAMLAVLPNAPALIHPGKNRALLLSKRNRLLDKLQANGVMDEFTCELAKGEPIPDKPHALPQLSRHLLNRVIADGLLQQKIKTTIQSSLQERIEQIIKNHADRLSGNQIHNACALVLDVEKGNVLAYVGNIPGINNTQGSDVDIIAAPRSTGSILKPFLFAAMLDDGKILPTSLLPDVPTIINGFAPKNFSRQYDGAVPANQALTRSLNVPAVTMLMDYRYERFHELLKNLGMTTLNQPPDHYGLALILGGAEGTLWDITGMYASLARTLNHHSNYAGSKRYDRSDLHAPQYRIHRNDDAEKNLIESSFLSAASIYETLDALKEVYRPGEETGWRYFTASQKIAWKTGTSFGFRDGWAVGVTPKYAVGVWVGNADGEGRPGLTGTETAAPIMFDIFSQVNDGTWFTMPKSEMITVEVCSKSGYRATDYCTEKEAIKVGREGLSVGICKYHALVHLTSDGKFQVRSDCESVSKMKNVNWFVLPPVQEYYYKPKNISYRSLPAYRGDCVTNTNVVSMDLVYPKSNARIFIPRELDGSLGNAVFELAHRNRNALVYWHIDDEYVGTTQQPHQLGLQPSPGSHKLTLVDDTGETLIRHFEVISSR